MLVDSVTDYFRYRAESEYASCMAAPRTITFTLNEDEAAAFLMLLVDCDRADPGAKWDASSFAKSMVLTILEDDLATHEPDNIH